MISRRPFLPPDLLDLFPGAAVSPVMNALFEANR